MKVTLDLRNGSGGSEICWTEHLERLKTENCVNTGYSFRTLSLRSYDLPTRYIVTSVSCAPFILRHFSRGL